MAERIPLAVPDLRGNEAAYLAQCVADNWVSSAGPFVDALEARMAALSARAHGVAMVNGTCALHLSLVAAGVRPGDGVIVPDWTFAATANAVCHAGGEPVFVDVTRETWTLDPGLVRAAFEARPVRAIIAVHALGHPADLDALAALSGAYGVPLIEDAAGAIGARHHGRPVGDRGAMAVFSFNGNKTVTAGGGGMIVTDDANQAARLRHLSTQARPGAAYIHDAVGYNYRMTNLNAAVGLAQLERLDEMVSTKRLIAARYEAALAERADLRFMPSAAWAESARWLSCVECASIADADALIAHLDAAGIEARVFWSALSAQRPYADCRRFLSGVSESLTGRIVALPSSSALTDSEQDRVLAALAAWRGGVGGTRGAHAPSDHGAREAAWTSC